MLDYRIKTFLTLFHEMNYRRTAEKLNMTQPGVTQHIHYIEDYYGVKLFSYDGKTLTKTNAAELLKRYIDSVLTEERETRNMFFKQEKTLLNIGATKTIGEFVLVPIVRNFLKDENNSINLTIDNTETLLNSLENAQLDFAIVEGVFDKSKYLYHLFKKENFVGICSKHHPFANKKVSLKEAFEQTLIAREPASGTRHLLEQAIANKGLGLDCFKRVISVSNFSVILDMIKKDSAITFAYEPIAKSDNSLATFEIEDLTIQGEFNFVYCNEHIAMKKIDMLFQNS